MEQSQAADRLTQILDDVEGGAESSVTSAPPNVPTASPPGAPPSEGIGTLFGGLAANPAILSSVLPALLSALSSAGGGGQTAPPPATPPSSSPTALPVAPPRKPTLDRHTALLCAVKPYLGERRQATAESVLRLCRVWDAMNRAGISPSLLAGVLGGVDASGTPQSSAPKESSPLPPSGREALPPDSGEGGV